MIDEILRLSADNLAYAEALISDVEDGKMAEQPAGIKNHPAWTIGHLAVSQDFVIQLMEQPSAMEPSWLRLFGSGAAPTDDRLNFPIKSELLSVLKSQHEKAASAFREHFERRRGAPNPFPPLVARFPTLGDLVLHLMTTHEAMHLGQMSAWRRAKELPAVTPVIAPPPPAEAPTAEMKPTSDPVATVAATVPADTVAVPVAAAPTPKVAASTSRAKKSAK